MCSTYVYKYNKIYDIEFLYFMVFEEKKPPEFDRKGISHVAITMGSYSNLLVMKAAAEVL